VASRGDFHGIHYPILRRFFMTRVLDTLAIILILSAMLVVLITPLACLPDGRWSINANAYGEMIFEVILFAIGTPFVIWRLILWHTLLKEVHYGN
jgi:hypothetical protein